MSTDPVVYRFVTVPDSDRISESSGLMELHRSNEFWHPIARFAATNPEGGPVVLGSKNAPIYGCFYEIPLPSGESVQAIQLIASSERVQLADWMGGNAWVVIYDLVELVELQARWNHLQVNVPLDTRLVPSTEVAHFGKDGFRVVAVLSPEEVVMERESRTGQ